LAVMNFSRPQNSTVILRREREARASNDGNKLGA